MSASDKRYEDQPLLRLLECYVLWAIGALSEAEAATMRKMTAKLNQIYQSDGDWTDALAKAMDLPPNMPELIRGIWIKNQQIARANDTSLTPQQFSKMFVDDNWRS
jgi:hypothetical protein